MDFQKKFEKISSENNSLLCIGLDPELASIRKIRQGNSLFIFNKAIIDSTYHLVCAYKPNIAFYEAYGIDGLNQLKKTLSHLHNNYPQIPVILDTKRADIGNTARMYAKSIFEYWAVDGTTAHPNLGRDSLEPFFDYKEKMTFLLIKTSNPDAKMFQDLKIDNEPYYLRMAEEIEKWKIKNLGIFVGATYPEDLKSVRNIFPDKIILTAGLGAQRADIKKAVKSGIDKNKGGIIFNASRSIIYSQNPKKTAQKLRDEINKYR